MDKMKAQILHLVYSERLDVAELAELSLGAQQFLLNFWIHVCQQVPHIIHRRQGELWEGQLQHTGWIETKEGRFQVLGLEVCELIQDNTV